MLLHLCRTKSITAPLSKRIQAIQHEYIIWHVNMRIYGCIQCELINNPLLVVIIYIQGIWTEQLAFMLTHFWTSKICTELSSGKTPVLPTRICSAARASYHALNEHKFVTYSVLSIKRRKKKNIM